MMANMLINIQPIEMQTGNNSVSDRVRGRDRCFSIAAKVTGRDGGNSRDCQFYK